MRRISRHAKRANPYVNAITVRTRHPGRAQMALNFVLTSKAARQKNEAAGIIYGIFHALTLLIRALPIKRARTILAAAVPTVILMTTGLTGCDDDDDNSGAAMSSGVLIDALVTGINYRCGSSTSASGTTNAAGMYTCPTGQSVSFYVGDILVGTIPTTLPKATPLDLDVGSGAFNGTWAGGSSQGVYMGNKQ